jgi:hypothetical protein
MSSVTALMTSHNIVARNNTAGCNTMTMNSVTALMTSHNIVIPNKTEAVAKTPAPNTSPEPFSVKDEFTLAMIKQGSCTFSVWAEFTVQLVSKHPRCTPLVPQMDTREE